MRLTSLAAIALALAVSACEIARGEGDVFLFYNSTTGEGAIGSVDGGEFVTKRTYPAGAFAVGWSNVAHVPLSGGQLLFYKSSNGAAAKGKLAATSFKTQKAYPAGSFGDWSNIVGLLPGNRPSRILFYNADTGAGALGFDPTVKSYPAGSFATGWRAIVPATSSNYRHVLFYNPQTGAGALGFDPTVAVYPAGSFSKGWTNVAATNRGNGPSNILLYKAGDGSAALGSIRNNKFVTDKVFPAGAFGTWTDVVGFQGGFLFYNRKTGAGALGAVEGGDFVTKKSYPAGAFAKGWTNIVVSDNSILID